MKTLISILKAPLAIVLLLQSIDRRLSTLEQCVRETEGCRKVIAVDQSDNGHVR